MIIYKFDAIKMPKEASGFKEDAYMLLIYASSDSSLGYLINGRAYQRRIWQSHANDIGKHFFTKEEYWSIIKKNPRIATDNVIHGIGKPTLQRYKEIVSDVFAKAKTIEEIEETTLTIASIYKTSKVFYIMGKDFSKFRNFDFNKGALNVDVDYLEYAIQPYYVIRLRDGTHLGSNPVHIRTCYGLHDAYQALSESEALDMADKHVRTLGEYGFEIIRIPGADSDSALASLKRDI